MAFPLGTYPIGGPIFDASGGLLTATDELRDAGVVSLRAGKIRRVNTAGDGWEVIPGHVIASTAPTSLFEGLLWYDTASNVLKHYNGSTFVKVSESTVIADDSITPAKLDAGDAAKKGKMRARIAAAGLASPAFTGDPTSPTPDSSSDDAHIATKKYVDDNGGAPADGSITPAKLDAGNTAKKNAFLTRLNALSRNLNNISNVGVANQRAVLVSLGSLIDGARPQASSHYSGRTWIDPIDDRAYVCRNRQEVSSAVGGLWADADTTTAGVEIAENLADLDDPASVNDYAYTYSDNKWWRGAVRNTQSVWRETQPTTALSAVLTLTPNWNTVWLGKHMWDYNATQQLPHSALPADTDYYFFNTRTVTVRKFKRADYSAAGTVFDHWQWESLVAIAAEIDIIEARDGNLPALSSDGSDDRKIAVANDGIHFVKLVPEAATAATVGTWTSYIFDKSNPTRRYIGVVSTDDPPSGTVGDFYYNSTFHRWRIYAPAGTWAWFNDHWEDLSDEDTAWPVRFVGHHATRAEATAYAASSGIKTGETFVAFTGSEIETASQFNAGASARFSRHWRFLPVGVAGVSTTGNDDYLNALAFTVVAGVVTAKATLHDGDVVKATGANLLAPLASPALTGEPTAPTPLPAGGNTQIATKKYVDDVAVGGNAGLVRGPLLAQVTLPTTPRVVGQAVFTSSELAWIIPAGVTGVTASAVDILNLDAIPDNVGDAAIGIFVCVTVGTDETLCEMFPWLHTTSSTSGFSGWWTKNNLFITIELGKSAIVGNVHWYMQLQSLVGGTSVMSYDADTKVNVYLARAAGPVGPEGPEGTVSAAQLAAETAERKRIDQAEAIARDLEDTALGTRITNENTGRTEGDTNEATARRNEDTALGGRITATRAVADAGVLAVTKETTAREGADIALATRIDALGGGGGGGLIETILFDGKVRGSSSNVLRTLNNSATPSYTDDVVVPETGDLLFMAYIAQNGAYAGHFQIPAKEFITRNGNEGDVSGQGQSTGFSFPVGQNRAITVTHRTVGSAKRFLWSSSHDVGGTSTEWRLEITHLTPAPPDAGEPSYKPGLAPFRFVGKDRAAAVAAREEYFLGEVALSQAYVDIYSAGNASRIRVTLDPSVTEQVGAAGNAWNLVLGIDHTNTSVSITPDTAAKTFTLRLPSAGIRLDALATDLDHNSRLNAEVVGNGSSLVNYIATWGPNPASGSTSPFGGGAVQSTTERTSWRANYEADPELVLVLDYGIIEEYQHWNVAIAPVVSDWETVLTLIDPPSPIWSAGSSQNLFIGTSRTAAVAARDEYSLRNTGVTQSSRLLPLGTSTTQGVLVTLAADAAIGTVGDTWAVVANGAAFAGIDSALTYDVVQQVVGVNYNAANLTAEALAHLFNVTPGFSAELVGGISQRAVGFIAAQIAGAFSGGVNAPFNARNVWIADYDNDSDQYITLSYGQILERQVRRASMWSTVDTIEVPKAVPAGVRLLVHDNAVPGENFQWWQNVTNSAVGQSFIERTGGTIQMETVGSQYLSIPAINSVVYFRVSDGTNTTIATLAHLVLPDGTRVASSITVMLGSQAILLTILASGRVVGTRPTVGTTNVGLDAWVQ